MSMFSKIKSFLFEETETDILPEEELEDISMRQTLKEKKTVEETPVVKQEEVVKPRMVREPATTQIEKEQAITGEDNKSKFVSINIDEAKPVEKKEVQKQPLKKNETKDFEFTPVISPIFGAKEEHVKDSKRDQVHIMKKAAKKPNPLGTIISPYFGVNELEEFEEEAKEEIANKELEKAIPVEMPKDIADIAQFDLQEEKEVHNVSLDELISDELAEENEDDLMQISLFGESAPVHDEDTQSLKIKEEQE